MYRMMCYILHIVLSTLFFLLVYLPVSLVSFEKVSYLTRIRSKEI
jgi:hypothetical protein